MSTKISDPESKKKADSISKRRRKPQRPAEIRRKPIRLVSSLGEGKLIDKFQNAIGEKENKKNQREKSKKERKYTKEKREREVARFKAELDALLEDDNSQPIKQKDNKSYVPKLSGTVKGKFQALEQKKKEEEKNKICHERQQRMTRDMVEKKRIQIEIARKKQKGLVDDDEESFEDAETIPKKKPGKLKSNFENIGKERMKREKEKMELEKQRKLSAEIQAVKEYYSQQHEDDSEDEEKRELRKKQVKPKKLKSNFDNLLREKEEKEREEAERRKKQLEEETEQFRAAKLAAQLSSSQEDTSSNESFVSQTEKITKYHGKPNRLSSSFTKFDVLEKKRIEEERTRIREKRKALLEEERKVFEEARKQETENDDDAEKENFPGNFSSLFDFDANAQQKLEEQRNRIHQERKKLLEEEKLHFLNQKKAEASSADSGSDIGASEEKNQDGRNRKKISRTPSKLGRTRLQFDVLERERLENERIRIQKQRQSLLEEEKKLFEQARENEEKENAGIEFDKKNNKATPTPGRLDGSLTRFDILTKQRMEEERVRIIKERHQLMEEEKKLMEEERKKIQENEEILDAGKNETKIQSQKPKRLGKSFTEFDVMERERIKKEEKRMYEEKAQKLEEEKRLFKEAKDKMKVYESFDEDDKENENAKAFSNCNLPNKLPTTLTQFDILERERMEQERLEAQKEKIKQLEEELKDFEEQKKANNQDSDNDDLTCGARELLKSSKKGPRPKRLSASLTQFDILEQKRREEERSLLQKQKAEQLAREREMFDQSKKQENRSSDGSNDAIHDQADQNYRSVKKLNIREKMEAVLKAQEEEERKRIEETKFTRMTVEQQEIYLAKQRQIEFLKQQLTQAQTTDFSDDDSYDESDEEYSDDDENYYYRYSEEDGDSECYEGEEDEEDAEDEREEVEEEDTEATSLHSCSTTSNSSGSYSGAPYFVQTLRNLTVKEGDPVSFDANVNANPHPKVTWYFKNRLIRNSPDYQYITKGTQYSLYMNESFLDDVGEYMCKASNEKGSATSKAYLTVKEME